MVIPPPPPSPLPPLWYPHPPPPHLLKGGEEWTVINFLIFYLFLEVLLVLFQSVLQVHTYMYNTVVHKQTIKGS